MASERAMKFYDYVARYIGESDLLGEILAQMTDAELVQSLHHIITMHDIPPPTDDEDYWLSYLVDDEGYERNPCGRRRMNASRTTVSIWFDQGKFTKRQAQNWLRSHGDYKVRGYETDGFYSFPQMSESKIGRYRGKIRSKYISDGIMIKFVPARFMR